MFFWNLGPCLENPLCKKLTRWSQRVASLWVGRCIQRPFFEEVMEESLENFVNNYVKRLGLWSDTTIHNEPFKQWMFCITSLDLLVKMTSKCIKHQPDGLLQSAIVHTNLWENTSLRYSSVWSPLYLAVGDTVM